MDIAQVIAKNLSTLMAADPERDTLIKVSKAAGVGFGTVRRAKNGDGNLTVANLELLAHAFRRSARDLLLDDCTGYPAAPDLPSIGVTERSLPSAIVPEDRDIARVVDMMRRLTHEGKGRVAAYTQGLVEGGQFQRKANGVR